jgi:acetylornithine deacetylase/succinyl-diaminopimelate desuccinylase-like protein
LKELGLEVDFFDALPSRSNVVGGLVGSGGGKSVILNGHIDVCEDRLVEKWSRSPYESYIEGGELYGKGSSDMKGALACFLFILNCYRRCNLNFRGDILIESVIGEETGEPGTNKCLDKGYRADFVIVGESAKGATVLYAAVGLDPKSYQFIPSDLDLNEPGVQTLIHSYKETTGKDLLVDGGRGVIVDSGWFSASGIPVVASGLGDAYWARRIDKRVDLDVLSIYCRTLAIFLSKWCELAYK